MAFADPQTITIAAGSKNLVRVDSNRGYSEYRLVEATQQFVLFIRNSELAKEVDGRKKIRHNIKLVQTVFATTTASELVRECNLTVTHYAGDDPAAYDDVALAVAGMATAANFVKLNSFES